MADRRYYGEWKTRGEVAEAPTMTLAEAIAISGDQHEYCAFQIGTACAVLGGYALRACTSCRHRQPERDLCLQREMDDLSCLGCEDMGNICGKWEAR